MRCVGAEEVLGLDIVQLMVARDDGHDGRAVLGDERKRLARAVLREAEERGHGLDGAQARRMHLGERAVAPVPR